MSFSSASKAKSFGDAFFSFLGRELGDSEGEVGGFRRGLSGGSRFYGEAWTILSQVSGLPTS